MDLATEDELIMYRRLCDTIASCPQAFDKLLDGIEMKFIRAHTNSSVKFMFRRDLSTMRRLAIDIAQKEKMYWDVK